MHIAVDGIDEHWRAVGHISVVVFDVVAGE